MADQQRVNSILENKENKKKVIQIVTKAEDGKVVITDHQEEEDNDDYVRFPSSQKHLYRETVREEDAAFEREKVMRSKRSAPIVTDEDEGMLSPDSDIEELEVEVRKGNDARIVRSKKMAGGSGLGRASDIMSSKAKRAYKRFEVSEDEVEEERIQRKRKQNMTREETNFEEIDEAEGFLQMERMKRRRIARELEKDEEAAFLLKIKERQEKEKEQEEARKNPASNMGVVIDLSMKAAKRGKKTATQCISFGGGWSLRAGMKSFNSGGNIGSYEAISIIKEVDLKDKDKEVGKEKKSYSIDMPIRLGDTLLESAELIAVSINQLSDPSVQDVQKEMEKHLTKFGMEKADLSRFVTAGIPKVTHKIDDMYVVRGEVAEWGKVPYDVLSFVRVGKEGKKDFVLSLPAKYFKTYKASLEYIIQSRRGIMCENE